MNQNQKDRLLRIDHVAERLLKSPKSVRRLIAGGHFLCCKSGGSLRIWESSVEAYLRRITELWSLENGKPDDI